MGIFKNIFHGIGKLFGFAKRGLKKLTGHSPKVPKINTPKKKEYEINIDPIPHKIEFDGNFYSFNDEDVPDIDYNDPRFKGHFFDDGYDMKQFIWKGFTNK